MSLKLETFITPFILALAMLATRFHHFGSSVNLPDASLTVFFLLGLLSSWRWFPVFALLAGVIDYVAIAWGGVGDYCVTPAYFFLLPTYAVMTAGGYLARADGALRLRQILVVAVAALVSTTLAFAISNGSFYFFSDYFASLSYADYIGRTAKYFVSYLGYALLYIAVGIAVVRLVRAVRASFAAA